MANFRIVGISLTLGCISNRTCISTKLRTTIGQLEPKIIQMDHSEVFENANLLFSLNSYGPCTQTSEQHL